MSTPFLLNGSPQFVTLGTTGFDLQAPEWTGEGVMLNAQETTMRNDGGIFEARLQEMMQDKELVDLGTLEFEISPIPPEIKENPVRAGGLVAHTRSGASAVIFRTPNYGAENAVMVLYADEDGDLQWVFPEADSPDSSHLHFMIPRDGAEPPLGEKGPNRGPITKLMRRVIRVVAWTMKDPIGKRIFKAAKRWEDKKYAGPRFFKVEPSTDQQDAAKWFVPMEAADFELMGQGKSLFLVHGTFATAQYAFGDLILNPRFQALLRLYEGRIFAFNHPTAHQSIEENVDHFLAGLPADQKLHVDILTRSRGALVARDLLKRIAQKEVGARTLKAEHLVMVAPPNQGTPLTEAKHVTDWLHTYTTFLTWLPDHLITIGLEIILGLVQLVGPGGLEQLKGLASMSPQGNTVTGLNALEAMVPHCYVIGAAFDLNLTDGEANERQRRLTRKRNELVRHITESIFKGQASDLVVPHPGCFKLGKLEAAHLESDQRMLSLEGKYTDGQGEVRAVNHLNIMNFPKVHAQIIDWFVAANQVST
ncbi:MAG: hypothetical protein AAFP92_26980 [Bacteroidota bacterium]